MEVCCILSSREIPISSFLRWHVHCLGVIAKRLALTKEPVILTL